MSASAADIAPSSSPHTPECPRCGYDQQGAVASWHADPAAESAACPLTGTCSECGLVFAWPDLLLLERTQCPGLFEHVRGFDARFSAWWRNTLWMIFPAIFWSRVKLHHIVRPRRILLPIVVAIVLFVLERILLAVFVGIGLFAASPNSPTDSGPLDDLNWYGMNEWPIAGLFPYFRSTGWGMESTDFGGLLAAIFASALMWPLLLLVLPQTRAQAKIRLAHIQRAFLYSLWPLSIIFTLSILGLLIDALAFTGLVPASVPIRHLAILIIVPAISCGVIYVLWLAVWWSVAINTGWKVHRGWPVAILLSFTSLLAAFSAFVSVRMYI
jgi:hypothetical protein